MYNVRTKTQQKNRTPNSWHYRLAIHWTICNDNRKHSTWNIVTNRQRTRANEWKKSTNKTKYLNWTGYWGLHTSTSDTQIQTHTHRQVSGVRELPHINIFRGDIRVHIQQKSYGFCCFFFDQMRVIFWLGLGAMLYGCAMCILYSSSSFLKFSRCLCYTHIHKYTESETHREREREISVCLLLNNSQLELLAHNFIYAF